MFEQQPESRGVGGGILKLLGGLFLGGVVGIMIPATVFMFVMGLVGGKGAARFWVAEIVNLGILGGIGYLTYQKIAGSMLALGFMIGISLAFLLNVICGIVVSGIR
jgi:hypothetical protein